MYWTYLYFREEKSIIKEKKFQVLSLRSRVLGIFTIWVTDVCFDASLNDVTRRRGCCMVIRATTFVNTTEASLVWMVGATSAFNESLHICKQYLILACFWRWLFSHHHVQTHLKTNGGKTLFKGPLQNNLNNSFILISFAIIFLRIENFCVLNANLVTNFILRPLKSYVKYQFQTRKEIMEPLKNGGPR